MATTKKQTYPARTPAWLEHSTGQSFSLTTIAQERVARLAREWKVPPSKVVDALIRAPGPDELGRARAVLDEDDRAVKAFQAGKA